MTAFNLTGFDIVELCTRGEAEMQMNKNYITFTKALIDKMESPQYVRLLINPKTQGLALIECKLSDKNSFKFSDAKSEKSKNRYSHSKALRKAIEAVMGEQYNPDKFYGFKGDFFADDKVMVFNLSNAYERNMSRYENSLGKYRSGKAPFENIK